VDDRIALQSIVQAWLDRLPLRRRVIAYMMAQTHGAYLVGGAVRDLLLGRATCDLDLAVERDAMLLARQLADHLRAAYVPLDEARDVARVVVRVGAEQRHVDIARLRAEGIEADLWARDYTINAMAIPLRGELDAFLDPTGGRADLAARRLRAASARGVEDDPARILRGVRQRAALGFDLTPETETLARASVGALARVSAERIRDELWLILAEPHAAASLAYAADLGVWRVLLPELTPGGALEQALATLDALEADFGGWAVGGNVVDESDDPNGLARFRAALRAHWAEELSFGRARWQALKWMAFIGACSVVAVEEIAQRLRLSVREVEFIGRVRAAVDAPLRWAAEAASGAPDALGAYRYYRSAGSAGVDAAILALAMQRARPYLADATRLCACVERLLDAWFVQRARLLDPPQLLSGGDLMDALHMKPGPAVGRMLEAIREAQVQGWVYTRDEALRYARERAEGQ